MNRLFRSATIALALAGATFGLCAEPALKVVTFDMDEVYTKYYKTVAQTAKMEDQAKRAREAEDGMKKEIESLVAEAKDLQDQSKSQIATEDARKKALEALEAKVTQIRGKDAERQEFLMKTQNGLQKQMAAFQQQIFEEISKLVSEIGQKKGATLVLNKGTVPVVIYADPAYDITAEVISEINKDAPPAPAAKADSPATTPAK